MRSAFKADGLQINPDLVGRPLVLRFVRSPPTNLPFEVRFVRYLFQSDKIGKNSEQIGKDTAFLFGRLKENVLVREVIPGLLFQARELFLEASRSCTAKDSNLFELWRKIMKIHERCISLKEMGAFLGVLSCAAIMLLTAGAFSPAAVYGFDEDWKYKAHSQIVEPGHTLFGKSYNELADLWTNWLQLEPPETNPALDPDGSFCDLNQEGRFWFLAGTFDGLATRTCEIPEGKAIFFPILAFVSFPPEFPEEGDPDADPPTEDNVCLPLGKGIEGVRCDVNDDIPVAPNISLVVTIDGEKVEDPFAYRTQSPPGGFPLQIVEGGLLESFGISPGPRFPAVVDGYWILIKPLSAGFHTVSFGQDLDDDGAVDFGVNYDLMIEGFGFGEDSFDFKFKDCFFGKCKSGSGWKW